MQTEDHPIDYGEFEGVIPSGYGAGTVMLWDIGTFEWVKESEADFDKSRRKGDIKFRLHGTKLSGEFALVHIGERGRQYGGSSDGEKNWLMLKKRDASVVEGFEAIDLDVSVKTGRSLAEIAAEGGGDPREMRRAARARGTPPAAEPAVPAQAPALAPPPMLATTVERPFSRDGWLFELKYDGIRAMVSVAGDQVRISGRRGNDETAHYPEAQAIRAGIHANQAIVDGELVVLDAEGKPSFERMQQRINVTRDIDVRRVAVEHPVTFIAFDLLELDGRDLLSTELRIRKKTLRETIVDSPNILFAAHVERDGQSLFDVARKSGIEGIVGKRADSLYHPGMRSPEWVKIKSWLGQSCVIAGYTAGRGRRTNQLGALILAVLDGNRLVHCGQVGTGFDDKTLRDLKTRLHPLEVAKMPTRRHSQNIRTRNLGQARARLRSPLRRMDPRRHPPPPRLPNSPPRPAPRGLHERNAAADCRGAADAAVKQQPSETSAKNNGTPAKTTGRTTRGAKPSNTPRHTSDEDAKGGPPRAATSVLAPHRIRDRPGGAAGRSVTTGDEGTPRRQDPDDHAEQALAVLRTLHGNARWDIAGRKLPLYQLGQGAVARGRHHQARHDRVLRSHGTVHAAVPAGSPLSMQVFPDGIDGKSFWRKDKPAHAPAVDQVVDVPRREDQDVHRRQRGGDTCVGRERRCHRPASVAFAHRRAQRSGLGGLRPRSV